MYNLLFAILLLSLGCSGSSDAPDAQTVECLCEDGCPHEGTMRFIWSIADMDGVVQSCEEIAATRVEVFYEENAPSGGSYRHEASCSDGIITSPLLSSCTHRQGEGVYLGDGYLFNADEELLARTPFLFRPTVGVTSDVSLQFVNGQL